MPPATAPTSEIEQKTMPVMETQRAQGICLRSFASPPAQHESTHPTMKAHSGPNGETMPPRMPITSSQQPAQRSPCSGLTVMAQEGGARQGQGPLFGWFIIFFVIKRVRLLALHGCFAQTQREPLWLVSDSSLWFFCVGARCTVRLKAHAQRLVERDHRTLSRPLRDRHRHGTARAEAQRQVLRPATGPQPLDGAPLAEEIMHPPLVL